MNQKRADLHVHTNCSDSSFSPKEVVEYAKKIGLACVGICDHDTINGLKEALALGKEAGVEVVPGVEVSVDENGKELHILGYYIDVHDTGLLAVLERIRKERRQRLRAMVGLLNKHGFAMDPDDMLKGFGDVSISRLHIAQYMEAKRLIPSWRGAFKKYIGDGKPCYVASFSLTSKEAIELIKKAKGVSIIAHPGLNKIDVVLPSLLEKGIDGIEVYHSDHTSSVTRHYKQYAEKHGLLITGGSDCHGKAKGGTLMGRTSIPYSYVEALKQYRARS